MEAELRCVMREVNRMRPKVCCECQGHLRPATAEEVVKVQELLWDGDWPPEYRNHDLIAASLCVTCGHVVVFSHRDDMLAVWCPGFGLHRRVVASSN